MAEFTLKQMADDLADTHGITKKKMYAILKDLPVMISEKAKTGETVSFGGLFRLKVVDRAARVGRNPRTGEAVDIAAKKVFNFKAGKNAFNLKGMVE